MELQQPKAGRVRVHRTTEFKSQLVRLALEPSASVAGVAVEHGVNPNLLRRWIKESKLRNTAQAFVPVRIESSSKHPKCTPVSKPVSYTQQVEVNIGRGDLRIAFKVDSSQMVELGQVLREVLR